MSSPKRDLSPGQGSAPGKAILLGEHFVVHGSPALAVPLSGLRLVVKMHPRRGGATRLEGHLGACLDILSGALGIGASDYVVEVESGIPVGSGMGSSAALSVALARACAEAMGLPHDPQRDRTLSMRCERLAHGRPSGIDTEVCVTERPVWAEDGRFSPLDTGAGSGVGLVVLFAGQGGATGEMVARVGAFRRAQSARFESLAEATRARCHETRDLLGGGMGKEFAPLSEDRLSRLGAILCEQHRALQELGVSTPRLDSAVTAACEEGAFGAKLSGAGGGGAVVALASLGSTAHLAARLTARGLTVVTEGPLL